MNGNRVHGKQERGLRVLHVMNAFAGGAARSTFELARGLEDFGVESWFLGSEDSTNLSMVVARAGQVERVRSTKLYWWNSKIRSAWWKRPVHELLQAFTTCLGARGLWEIRRLHEEVGFDLIHTNTGVTPEGALAASSLSLPHIWHVREELGPGTLYPLGIWQKSAAKVFAQSAAVIANSSFSESAFQKCFPGVDTTRIPNGLQLSHFAEAFEGRPSWQERVKKGLRVSLVGHLSARMKGHDEFLVIADKMSGLFPKWKFQIFGSRAPTDPYAVEVVRSATGLVDLMGQATPEALFRESDVLLVLNPSESFGRVAVEAMAAGVMVVGADGGGIAEILNDRQSGFLVTPHDVEAYVECLASLPALGEKGQRILDNAKARAHESYALKRCAGAVHACYQKVLS